MLEYLVKFRKTHARPTRHFWVKVFPIRASEVSFNSSCRRNLAGHCRFPDDLGGSMRDTYVELLRKQDLCQWSLARRRFLRLMGICGVGVNICRRHSRVKYAAESTRLVNVAHCQRLIGAFPFGRPPQAQ